MKHIVVLAVLLLVFSSFFTLVAKPSVEVTFAPILSMPGPSMSSISLPMGISGKVSVKLVPFSFQWVDFGLSPYVRYQHQTSSMQISGNCYLGFQAISLGLEGEKTLNKNFTIALTLGLLEGLYRYNGLVFSGFEGSVKTIYRLQEYLSLIASASLTYRNNFYDVAPTLGIRLEGGKK